MTKISSYPLFVIANYLWYLANTALEIGILSIHSNRGNCDTSTIGFPLSSFLFVYAIMTRFEWVAGFVNTLVTTYFIWRNVFVMLLKLSDFVLLNYLATTFFNLATVFLWKSPNGDFEIFSISSPVEDGEVRLKEVEHQVGMRITSLLVKRT